MALELDPLRATIIAAMLVVLAGVAYVELRMMRNRRKKKDARGELPDRAHNALQAAKAIADALGRAGIRSVEADDQIREAETALENRNHRVAIELADRAKSVLRAEKAKRDAVGDLSKLEAAEPPSVDEPTVKEKLTKELPPNYMQAKFSMNLAREEIEAARNRGQPVGEAERMLAEAQATFDATDYTAALAQATKARRSLEGTATKSPPAPPQSAPAAPRAPTGRVRRCLNCGADVPLEDAFCRKCGTKVPTARTCPSCGSEVAADDAFCRKCGTKVPLSNEPVAKP